MEDICAGKVNQKTNTSKGSFEGSSLLSSVTLGIKDYFKAYRSEERLGKESDDNRDTNTSHDTDSWGEDEQKTDHDTGEIDSKDNIDGHEELGVIVVLVAVVKTNWGENDQVVEIEEE